MKYLLALIFSGLFLDATAQKVVVTGYVKDYFSGENLPYSTVYFRQLSTGIVANQYGHFSGRINKGKVELVVSFVGYKPDTLRLNIQRDTTLNISLKAPSIEEVTVRANRASIGGNDLNRISIPISRIKEMPPFLGEYDIIKALALTPGVNNGTDGTSSLFVRGGSSDQNLILLDGATVYNNSHLFGFISIFNPEAISHAELFKGNFPARYGERLSSVLNITMKEGNAQKRETNLTVGPISSQITTQGPLIKGKASYILSGRSTYSSLITLPIYLLSSKNSSRFSYVMYDLNAKVNYAFNENEKLFLSFYAGNDIWDVKRKENTDLASVDLNWGNTTASLRYTRQFRSGLFSISQLTYNRYHSNYETSQKSRTHPPEFEPSVATTGSDVTDFGAKQRFELSTGIRNSMVFGFDLAHQVFHPDYYQLVNIDLGSNIPLYRNTHHQYISAAAYIEDKFQVSRWLSINPGIRYSAQFLSKTTYQSLEPRLEFTANSPNGFNYSLGYSRMSQPIFQLTNTGQGLPLDVWVPITSSLKPEKADQWSAGMKMDLKKLPISVQAEVYYKKSSGLIEYNQGVSYVTNISKNWEQNIVRNGIGKSYGLELLLSKTTGKINYWVGYTLSRNYRKFDGINDGDWYFARFDRTHDFETTLVYKLNSKWKFSMNFVYNTGQPATLAATVHEDVFGHRTQVFTRRNNLRLPDYHRMDVCFSKEFLTKNKKRPATLSFGAFNVYSRVNPFYVTLEERGIPENIDPMTPVGYESKYESGTLFGIVPFVSYSVKF